MSKASRAALITGAAQGVGAAIAQRLSREGVDRFLLVDRQADKLAAVAKRLQAGGAKVHTLVQDLSDIHPMISSVEGTVADIGTIDILVNAAGTTARGGLSDTRPETFDAIFALNVRAPFFMMQTVVPAMAKGGVIVNICSMLAYGGPPFLLAYSASKAALVSLTKGAANTLKGDRLRVFGINLGWTWTPAEQEVQTRVHGLPQDWAEKIGARQPFGRLLMPEDPAGVVAFLASSDARMMTGAIIDLDQHVAGTLDDNPGA